MKMLVPSSLLSVFLLLLPLSEGALTLPKLFKNNMVLQQEPQLAHIWGNTDDLASTVTAAVLCQSGFAGAYDGTLVSGYLPMVFML